MQDRTSGLSQAVLTAAALLSLGCPRRQPAPQPPVERLVVPAAVMDVPVLGAGIGTLDGWRSADIRPKVKGYVLRQTSKEPHSLPPGARFFALSTRQPPATLS